MPRLLPLLAVALGLTTAAATPVPAGQAAAAAPPKAAILGVLHALPSPTLEPWLGASPHQGSVEAIHHERRQAPPAVSGGSDNERSGESGDGAGDGSGDDAPTIENEPTSGPTGSTVATIATSSDDPDRGNRVVCRPRPGTVIDDSQVDPQHGGDCVDTFASCRYLVGNFR